MLDLPELTEAQRAGERLLKSLSENEELVLHGYSYAAAADLLKMGTQKQVKVSEIVVNAFRNGIALGLALIIESGQILRRRS